MFPFFFFRNTWKIRDWKNRPGSKSRRQHQRSDSSCDMPPQTYISICNLPFAFLYTTLSVSSSPFHFSVDCGIFFSVGEGCGAMLQMFGGARRFLLEKMGNIIKKPEAKIVGVNIKDLSRDGVTYNAKVSVSNPYIVPIPIGEISYTLKSADRFHLHPFSFSFFPVFLSTIFIFVLVILFGECRMIVSGKIGRPGSLPGYEETVLEVPVRVAHTILLSLMEDIGADWDIDYQLDLGLTIHLPLVGDLTIPVSWKGEIKLPTLSSFLWSTPLAFLVLMVKYSVTFCVFVLFNESHASLTFHVSTFDFGEANKTIFGKVDLRSNNNIFKLKLSKIWFF